MRKPFVSCCALSVLGLWLGGCEAGLGHDASAEYVKPTVAVMKFENRAPFPLAWNLSDGMADMLVNRLMATKRYHVIERPELDSIVKELSLQQSGMTRVQNRAALGRIKNVEYLIKGTITDFGHVATNTGFFSTDNWNIFGGSKRAVMGMVLYVVEVESGEIICSESLEESVHASDLNVQAVYSGVAFGGSTFYRTPLGRATDRVIGKAVGKVTRSIANRPWQPKVAQVQPDGTVILNGGKDRGVAVGDEYEILMAGEPIKDPDSGDVIGVKPGKPVGRVRICEVAGGYSVASFISGKASDVQIGYHCRKAAVTIEKTLSRS